MTRPSIRGDRGRVGFTPVSFPASLIYHIVAALQDGLQALRRLADGTETPPPFAQAANAGSTLDRAIDLDRWHGIEANQK